MRPTLPAMVVYALSAFSAPATAQSCATTAANAPLTVTFFGVSTILFKAGNQAIMVDGFFSRPGFLETAASRLTPDPARIADGLAAGGVRRLNNPRDGETNLLALLVAQAHHDHSMDAAQVAMQTGATLLGSPSTLTGAGRDGFSGSSIELSNGLERCFGPFRVRAILSPHSPGFVPFLVRGSTWRRRPGPRHALTYRDNLNFSFHVSYGKRRILIHPSANHPPGGMGDIRADLVFLSLGDLGGFRRREPYIRRYWNAVVLPSRACLVIPIHWDNFLEPIPDRGETGAQNGLPPPLVGEQYRYAMREIRRHAADKVDIRFLNAFAETDVDRLIADTRARFPNCPGPGT